METDWNSNYNSSKEWISSVLFWFWIHVVFIIGPFLSSRRYWIRHHHTHELKKEMATHSSILAWEILWTEEPGGLQSLRLQRVGRNLVVKQQLQYKIKAKEQPNKQEDQIRRTVESWTLHSLLGNLTHTRVLNVFEESVWPCLIECLTRFPWIFPVLLEQ